MKKTLLLWFFILGFFWSQICLWADDCICIGNSTSVYPTFVCAMTTNSTNIASNSITSFVSALNNKNSCTKKVCKWDYEYEYYAKNFCSINQWIHTAIADNPYELDSFCDQFSDDYSNKQCKQLVESAKNWESYEESMEKHEKEQEQIKKQAEIEKKQKELEEKQAELEQKQKELEEENEKLKQQQEKNTQIEESTSKIVEELNKTEELPDMTEEVSKAKEELWTKAAIFNSLVPLFNKKDEKIKANVRALCKTFTQSKDAYTRNIWLYFGYLIQE